jgi:hypothetical protein
VTSFDFNLATLIPTGLTALLTFAVYRINRGQEARDRWQTDTEGRVRSLELAIVRDLPSKEDFSGLSQRLDRLDDTLKQVRDMVIRLDERGKHNVPE